MPQAYWIIPLEGGRIDNTLPGGPPGHVGGGPVYPGGPTDPGYGRPGWSPADPGYGKPIYHPGHPDHGLPSGPPDHPWFGIPGDGRPDNALPLPQGGTEVPEDIYPPPAVPEEIASQYIVSVYNPKTMTWTTKSYPPR